MTRQDLPSDQMLRAEIASALDDTDPDMISIVTAVAGLLAAVAYADRQIDESELARLKTELARIQGFRPTHVDAVTATLQQHALRLNTTYVPRFTRTLREELPAETRLEVLDALLAMAAADRSITFDEVSQLRNITTALGLSQQQYNELQGKYRELLS